MDEPSRGRRVRGRSPDVNTAAPDAGRQAFSARAWTDAYVRLSEAQSSPGFEPRDLERLAICAYLTGHDQASEAAWVRAHQEYLRADDVPRAVRCAFWLVMQLLSLRESARAGGWLATAHRLLGGYERECAEHGLMLVVEVRRLLREGNVEAALDASAHATAIAGRCADGDLLAFSLLTQGLARARHGEWTAAAACFDEVMVAVSTGNVSPLAVGIVYCAVIEACYEIADVARAREWTDTLTQWCAAQPDLVAFRGHCGVHRAETLRFGGAWRNALAEASQVCRGSTGQAGAPGRGFPIGAACYEIAEIHRMQGEFAKADANYREASLHGRTSEPGLALLRLAQGQRKTAVASIRQALEARLPRIARASVLAASVEIGVDGGDIAMARRSADELVQLAGDLPAPFLRALSSHALGAVLLAEGNPQEALTQLRDAWMGWQSLEIPYEAARVRVLIARACQALGDLAAASLECDAARRVFVRLGATHDVARLDALHGSSASGPLTPREVQVMKLVASGRTNRAIARALGISERTVDRHVSNILTKLDLSSRTAATAYAYEHGLL